MKVTVVDYNAGNLTSVTRACAWLGVDWEVVSEPAALEKAERLIFPGVGHARSAMEYLESRGLADALRSYSRRQRPFLGICLGSQIVLDHSQEGDVACLGILSGEVRHFGHLFGSSDQEGPLGGYQVGGERLKVPHMGWSEVTHDEAHPAARTLFRGIPQGTSFYFVHSYYTDPGAGTAGICSATYGLPFTVGLARDHVAAFQFHPEKSGAHGLALLRNFMDWRP